MRQRAIQIAALAALALGGCGKAAPPQLAPGSHQLGPLPPVAVGTRATADTGGTSSASDGGATSSDAGAGSTGAAQFDVARFDAEAAFN